MKKTITATNARVHFGEMLDDIERTGIRVVVERAGKPVAAILPISDLALLDRAGSDTEALIARVDALRSRIAKRRGEEPMPDTVEEIRQMREERDAQLLDDLLRR